MALHRKPTHRPKILAAAFAVALTASGAAFAAQLAHEPVRTAPQPLLTRAASPTASAATIPEDFGEAPPRPTRSAETRRPALDGKATRDRSQQPRSPGGHAGSKAPRPKTAPETVDAPSPTAVTTPETTTGPTTPEATVLEDSEAARADAGLASLDPDDCLAQLAQRHAERLAAAGRLYHQDLGTVMRTCGVSAAGENVAMNPSGPSGMVGQWLASPGHRANLLSSRFTLIGIGVAQARDGAWYGVQVFGSG